MENGREGAGTERGKVEKGRQNKNSLKKEVLNQGPGTGTGREIGNNWDGKRK